MFGAVTIDSSGLDIGSAGEALIYYGNVNLVVTGGSLVNFVKEIGSTNTLRLLESGALQLTYERNLYVVKTDSKPFRVHDFAATSLMETAEGRKIKSPADEIDHIFLRELGPSAQTKRFARDISDRIIMRKLDAELPQLAKRDAFDLEFITSAVRAWLQTMVPEYQIPRDFKIDIMDTGKGFVFLTGLDFEEINKFYHRRISPTHSSVTDSYLLANVLGSRKALFFSSNAESDLWMGPGESAMLRTRIDNMIAKRADFSHKSIETFHEIEFEGRTFREALNSKERGPADLMALLEDDETKKFRQWLVTQEPTALLIKEYDRAVFSKTGWTQRLPFKLGKIFTFAGVGAAVDASLGTMGLATLTTSALSAASDVAVGSSDEFVLSKMLKGWKPNQFVEGPARQFLNKQE